MPPRPQRNVREARRRPRQTPHHGGAPPGALLRRLLRLCLGPGPHSHRHHPERRSQLIRAGRHEGSGPARRCRPIRGGRRPRRGPTPRHPLYRLAHPVAVACSSVRSRQPSLEGTHISTQSSAVGVAALAARRQLRDMVALARSTVRSRQPPAEGTSTGTRSLVTAVAMLAAARSPRSCLLLCCHDRHRVRGQTRQHSQATPTLGSRAAPSADCLGQGQLQIHPWMPQWEPATVPAVHACQPQDWSRRRGTVFCRAACRCSCWEQAATRHVWKRRRACKCACWHAKNI